MSTNKIIKIKKFQAIFIHISRYQSHAVPRSAQLSGSGMASKCIFYLFISFFDRFTISTVKSRGMVELSAKYNLQVIRICLLTGSKMCF